MVSALTVEVVANIQGGITYPGKAKREIESALKAMGLDPVHCGDTTRIGLTTATACCHGVEVAVRVWLVPKSEEKRLTPTLFPTEQVVGSIMEAFSKDFPDAYGYTDPATAGGRAKKYLIFRTREESFVKTNAILTVWYM